MIPTETKAAMDLSTTTTIFTDLFLPPLKLPLGWLRLHMVMTELSLMMMMMMVMGLLLLLGLVYTYSQDPIERAIAHLPTASTTLPFVGDTFELMFKQIPRIHDWIYEECCRQVKTVDHGV